MNRLFIIEGCLICTAPVPNSFLPDPSVLWYCKHCGEVYARIPVPDRVGPWMAFEGCCKKCDGTGALCPGSIYRYSGVLAGPELPKEIVDRELKLYLDDYYRRRQDDSISERS